MQNERLKTTERLKKDGEAEMTFGQLFMIMNPNVKVKENRTCYWLYFDESNHHTFSTKWWEKEIPGMISCDAEKIAEAFDEAKELVWADDDEYTVGYNNGLEAGKGIAIELLKEQERRIVDLEQLIAYERNVKARGSKQKA